MLGREGRRVGLLKRGEWKGLAGAAGAAGWWCKEGRSAVPRADAIRRRMVVFRVAGRLIGVHGS